jgi:AraC-like DNA-binding protein
MSRSAFAANFRDRVGRPPLDYLIEWRMQLARAALRTDDSLTAIAGTIGYQSESAFSTAFRRVVGMSPREFRVSLRAQPGDRRSGRSVSVGPSEVHDPESRDDD